MLPRSVRPRQGEVYLLLCDPPALAPRSSAGPVLALARGLASSVIWQAFREAVLVVREGPRPLLGAAGFFDEADRARMDALRWQLQDDLPRLRRIDYIEAQEGCLRLAARLCALFGDALREDFHYLAIPRGGYIVFGMLAYALELVPDRLVPQTESDRPLVVVDDCALSGARFKRLLPKLASSRIVFATLYSPPALRRMIEAREPQVTCVSAHDLEDEAPRRQGAGYEAWLEAQRRRRGDEAYWFGQYPPFGFAWNEPDSGFWNPVTERREKSWNLMPPEACLKNRLSDEAAARIQVQREGPGPLVTADDVLYGDLGDTILIGQAMTGGQYRLEGVGADMWRAIITHGAIEPAAAALLEAYEVDEATLRRDLDAFAEDLLARGLLEWRRNA